MFVDWVDVVCLVCFVDDVLLCLCVCVECMWGVCVFGVGFLTVGVWARGWCL